MNKIKKFVKENYKWALIYIMTFLILTFKLPYYIEMPGGLIDVSKRIEIEDANSINGSINLAYVSSSEANLINLGMSLIFKDWSVIKKDEIVADNESVKDANYRNRLSLDEANQTAILLAYKKANKEVTINDSNVYVTYIHKNAKTDLKVGDEIISINGIEVSKKSDVVDIIKNIKANEKMDIEVINNNKHYIKTAEMVEYGDSLILGILLCQIDDITLKQNIKFNFKSSESGASGGLMMTLAIYNYLIDEDLVKGRKIAGTGTIESDGTVGEIDGVKYKIMGAVKSKAEIFFVPVENYEEAMKVKIEKKYDIDIVKVSNLDEAIEYLKRK